MRLYIWETGREPRLSEALKIDLRNLPNESKFRETRTRGTSLALS